MPLRSLLFSLVFVLVCAACSNRNMHDPMASANVRGFSDKGPPLPALEVVPPKHEKAESLNDKHRILSKTVAPPLRSKAMDKGQEPEAPSPSPVTVILHCNSGSIALPHKEKHKLQELARLMRKHPGTFARISGYTDNTGSASVNLALSLRRARNLRFLLVRDHGISLDRLQALGFGEISPMADNATAQGRAANRRIVVELLPSREKETTAKTAQEDAHHAASASQMHRDTSAVISSTKELQGPVSLTFPSVKSGPREKKPLATPRVSSSSAAQTPPAQVSYTSLSDASAMITDRAETPSRISGRYTPSTKAPSTNAAALSASQGIEIVAVGDIMMGTTWPRSILPPDDGNNLFSHTLPLFQGADVIFGNLEGPLADTGRGRKCRRGSSRCYEFRMPTRYVQHLQRAGFNALSIANNHARDLGIAGQESTIRTLQTAGIQPVGGKAVGILHKKGKRIAVVGFSHRAGSYSYAIQNIAKAKTIVQRLEQENDVVIVSFHGGAEGTRASRIPAGVEYFLGENRGDVQRFAHAVIDAGADLVLGHGPHVLRAMERYKGKLIAYSLGNFLTYELFSTRGACGQSVVLRLTLDPQSGNFLHGSLAPLQLTADGLPRPDEQQTAIRQIMQLSRQFTAQNPLQFEADPKEIAFRYSLK